MEINPIYKFMKDNGLTQKDEATFVSEYSNPQKSAELHKFMVDNGLTTKGADDFYSEYFAGSKKRTYYSRFIAACKAFYAEFWSEGN